LAAVGLIGKKAVMKLRRSVWILSIALGALLALLLPVSASAQSCALCYTQAASSGSRMIQALKSGILILITPPTLGSVGVIVVMYRKRNQVRKAEQGDHDDHNDRDWED
jgi:hypothetical protein